MTHDRENVGQWLLAAGLLPADYAGPFDSGPFDSGDEDLLPSLAAIWSRHAADVADQRQARHARGLAGWCHEARQRGSRLTAAPPGMPRGVADRWFGARLAFWPTGIPSGKRVGLASSRLGRRLEARGEWFTRLRAVCGAIDPQNEVLLTSDSSTTDRFLDRAAELFGVRVLRARIDDTQAPVRWGRRIRQYPIQAKRLVEEVLVSPPLSGVQVGADAATAATTRPESTVPCSTRSTVIPTGGPARDRAIVALSDRLLVLHVRPDGHWQDLLSQRLADDDCPVGGIFVALEGDEPQRELVRRLMDLGAVGWFVWPAEDHSRGQNLPDREPHEPLPAPVLAQPPVANDWDYLTHATRRRDGAWPEQTDREFLDDLILARNQVDRTPLTALQRILTQRCLRASVDAIRGGQAVVSFTSIPLSELPRHRVFRAHRIRWDFEPYGVCIRRDWLTERGARMVHYGDEADWTALPDAERPFFQLRQTRGLQPVDWSAEQEWRSPGDVLLESLPADGAFVFVPTRAEAEWIARFSRWPVVILEAGNGDMK